MHEARGGRWLARGSAGLGSPVLAVLACSSVACSGAQTPEPRVAATAAREVPALERPVPAPVSLLAEASIWVYALPVDYGIRADSAGDGRFRARRTHGEHNGIDLLAPVGTPAIAVCDGEARSGNTGAFGNWVQLVCEVPPAYGGVRVGYLSVFYAHLSSAEVGAAWAPVSRSRAVGRVGKTGNARGDDVEPHLHLEVIALPDHAEAQAESHSGLDQSDNPAVSRVITELERKCLTPAGFYPVAGELQRARRLDPFLVLTCLAANKPTLSDPPPPLGNERLKWSDVYRARSFDVDRGHPTVAVNAGL